MIPGFLKFVKYHQIADESIRKVFIFILFRLLIISNMSKKKKIVLYMNKMTQVLLFMELSLEPLNVEN